MTEEPVCDDPGNVTGAPELEASTFPAIPINWATQPADAAAARLDEVKHWVTWLIRRYQLDQRTIPDCWSHHGAHIEELSALYTAWTLAYLTTSPPDAPLAWQHAFAASRQRLQDWHARTGCRPGNHRGP